MTRNEAKLELFKEFPNRKDRRFKDYANLKSRIDTCAGQVRYCRKLLQDNGIL